MAMKLSDALQNAFRQFWVVLDGWPPDISGWIQAFSDSSGCPTPHTLRVTPMAFVRPQDGSGQFQIAFSRTGHFSRTAGRHFGRLAGLL